jgi:hypothetical protein
MLIIEKSLDPSLDESQRILAGPLITDLAIKVPPLPSPTSLSVRNPLLTFSGQWGNSTSSSDIFNHCRDPIIYRHKTGIHSGLLSPHLYLK